MLNCYAEFINTEMEKQEMSISALSRGAGVPHSTISQIVRGKVSPQIGTFERICDALGYDLIMMKRIDKKVKEN